jgi:hypothetical protein
LSIVLWEAKAKLKGSRSQWGEEAEEEEEEEENKTRGGGIKRRSP